MENLIKVFLIIVLSIGLFLFIYVVILKKKIDKEEIKYQLEEFKKSRALVGTLCLIIASILCFVITPAFTTALNTKIKVLETTRNIKIGEKLNDSMFREIEIGSYGLNPNIITNKNEIKNKYATIDLYKGQYVYKSNISEKIPYKDEYLYSNLTGTNRAISFTIKNLSNGLSNKLIQGDIISIIVINQSAKTEKEQTYIPEELKYVEVLTTTNNDGNDIKYTDNNKNNEDNIYQTITVLVCDEQAKIIANAELTKQLFVELVYRQGNQKIAKYLLSEQETILKEKYPEMNDNTIKNVISKLNKEDTTEETTKDNDDTNNILEDINNALIEQIENNKKIETEETKENIEETTKEIMKETKDNIKETTKEIIKETENIYYKEILDLEKLQKEEFERLKKQYNAK